MPTIGLCIIVKQLTPQLQELTEALKPHFYKVFIQVNGKDLPLARYQVLDVEYLSDFTWNNNFADARNALLRHVDTDYWFWLDDDDTIDHPEAIRPLVEDMEAKGVERMFALYEYAKNDIGEEIGAHWRERIIKTSHPFKWLGAVHETLISPIKSSDAKTEEFRVIHHKDQKDFEAGIKRNHKILEVEYKKGNDPRITMYLGMSYFTMKQWERANELLIEHIRTSGSLEDKYRSWLKVAECHSHLSETHKSIKACNEAIDLLPHYPDAYFAKGQFYYELEDYVRCLEWLKIGASKPDPTTLSIVDPTLRYRSLMMGALAEFQLGRVKDAWVLIKQVLDISPDYALANKFYPIFEQAYLENEAIDHAKWLITYAKNYKGKPVNVLKALPDSLALDIRLNGVRTKLFPPKIWPKKSIAYFCGPSNEPWGPDTLDKGIGGSEEAVIYLSRELAKLGWAVTVYCDREESYDDNGVTYLPWHTFNPKDKFDVFIAWRSGSMFTDYPISANFKGVDLHDTPIGHATINKENAEAADKFFFKSRMQRELAENVPDDKVAVISNGIVKEQFDV